MALVDFIYDCGLISTEPDDLVNQVEKAIKVGFNHLYLHTNPDENKFIAMAATHVIPYVKSTYG